MPVQRGYICTNLITPGRKTLADIRVEAFDESMLVELEDQIIYAGEEFDYPIRIYDPV